MKERTSDRDEAISIGSFRAQFKAIHRWGQQKPADLSNVQHPVATVATTTGTRNVEWVRELGADIVIDYRTQDFETIVQDYDVVLDSQGGDTLAKSLRVLKPGGMAIGIAGPPDPDFARQQGLRFPLRLAMTVLSLKTHRAARSRGVRYSFLFMRASGTQLDEITKLIDTAVLRPIIDKTYPFDEAPQALAHAEGGRATGKVVITGHRLIEMVPPGA